MVNHTEDRPSNHEKKRLVAFYVSNTLWSAFEGQAKRQRTTVFALLRKLMYSYLVDEEAKGN
jgi:hypothetical protein